MRRINIIVILIIGIGLYSIAAVAHGADGQLKASIVVGDRALASPKAVLSHWLIYGATRLLWIEEKYSKENPNSDDYKYTFAEELDARKMMACIWEESRAKDPTLSDEYLDTLVKINNAGFIAEYVWSYFSIAEWDSTKQPLRLDDFKEWKQINLQEHKPLTLVTVKINNGKTETQQKNRGDRE